MSEHSERFRKILATQYRKIGLHKCANDLEDDVLDDIDEACLSAMAIVAGENRAVMEDDDEEVHELIEDEG